MNNKQKIEDFVTKFHETIKRVRSRLPKGTKVSLGNIYRNADEEEQKFIIKYYANQFMAENKMQLKISDFNV